MSYSHNAIFLKKNLLYSWEWGRQIKYMILMTKKRSTMIENFMNSPGAGILVCVGAVLMIYTLIVIVLKAYYAALTSAIVDFYLFYDGHVDMQI